jgi:hypothetical protein
MPFVAIPLACKVELAFTYQGLPGANVLGAICSATPDTAELQDVADAMEATMTTDILPGKSNQFTLDEIIVTDLNSATGPQVTNVVATAGAVTASAIMVANALVIQLHTALRGRSFRGRVFDAGWPDSYLDDDGRMTPTNQANLTAAWENVRSAMDTAGHPLAVISRTLQIPSVVTQVHAATVVGLQRRRLFA